jgi:hypothetical protein
VHIPTAGDGKEYTLHVHTDGGGKGDTLHVHTQLHPSLILQMMLKMSKCRNVGKTKKSVSGIGISPVSKRRQHFGIRVSPVLLCWNF